MKWTARASRVVTNVVGHCAACPWVGRDLPPAGCWVGGTDCPTCGVAVWVGWASKSLNRQQRPELDVKYIIFNFFFLISLNIGPDEENFWDWMFLSPPSLLGQS